MKGCDAPFTIEPRAIYKVSDLFDENCGRAYTEMNTLKTNMM